MIKETLRWRPAVRLVPPHELLEDLQFERYHFPAGTDYLLNSLVLSAEFADADELKLERWRDGEEGNADPHFWGLGGGRRICDGYKVAQQALYLAYARISCCFSIEPVSRFANLCESVIDADV